MVETTTIEVKVPTYQKLSGRKRPGDSFDDVIRGLLEGTADRGGEDRGDGDRVGEGLTCPNCGHSWTYTGSAEWPTCPSCQRKFQRDF